MKKIEELKIKAADLFYTREQLNAQLMQVNQQLQQITNEIESEVKNGATNSN